ncbi:MAG: hypothetical protein M9907_00015 [Burkholderiaceae bacterium]|nr:hypothetical protein [Burkholderiaceae bacterium]
MDGSEPSPDVRATGDAVIAAVRSFVGRALAPLIERLDALARRAESTDQLVADLEARLAAVEARERAR